jgi:hypothetical protein
LPSDPVRRGRADEQTDRDLALEHVELVVRDPAIDLVDRDLLDRDEARGGADPDRELGAARPRVVVGAETLGVGEPGARQGGGGAGVERDHRHHHRPERRSAAGFVDPERDLGAGLRGRHGQGLARNADRVSRLRTRLTSRSSARTSATPAQ